MADKNVLCLFADLSVTIAALLHKN